METTHGFGVRLCGLLGHFLIPGHGIGKIIRIDKVIAGIVGRIYVPADFDTIENAFSGAKPPKKAYNKGFRGRFLTSKALFRCVQLWFRRSAEPWGKRFAVYDFGNN